MVRKPFIEHCLNLLRQDVTKLNIFFNKRKFIVIHIFGYILTHVRTSMLRIMQERCSRLTKIIYIETILTTREHITKMPIRTALLAKSMKVNILAKHKKSMVVRTFRKLTIFATKEILKRTFTVSPMHIDLNFIEERGNIIRTKARHFMLLNETKIGVGETFIIICKSKENSKSFIPVKRIKVTAKTENPTILRSTTTLKTIITGYIKVETQIGTMQEQRTCTHISII